MDPIELRVLALAGLLAVGIAVSTLAVPRIAVAGWIGRVSHARRTRAAGGEADGGRPDLGVGRARC